MGASPAHPQNKVHSPVPVADGRVTDIIAEVPLRSTLTERLREGARTSHTLFNLQDWEWWSRQKARLLSQQIVQISQSGCEEKRRGGGSFQSPSLLHPMSIMGLPGDPTRAQPWDSNLIAVYQH